MTQPGLHRREVPEVTPPQITEPRECPDFADVRARHETAAMAGEHAHHRDDLTSQVNALRTVTRSWQDVSTLHDFARVLACDVLAMAQAGGMPSTYWQTDRRIDRALNALGLSVEEAYQINWASLPTAR